MNSRPINELLTQGRLERVPVDLLLARRMLRTATRNLDAIESIAESATELAYTGAYDATRLAITAHMAAHGIRLTNRPRAHVAVMQYGENALGGLVPATVLDGLDRMRRVRNDTEYDARPITLFVVEDAQTMAIAVTRAVVEEIVSLDR